MEGWREEGGRGVGAAAAAAAEAEEEEEEEEELVLSAPSRAVPSSPPTAMVKSFTPPSRLL